MPVIQGYKTFNMLSTQMYYGYVTTATSNQITITDYRGNTGNYYGIGFQYAGDNVVAGRLTGYNLISNYSLEFAINSANFSAPEFAVINNSGDAQAIWRYVLVGNDVVNGSPNNDVLIGFTGDDQINGGGGNDTMYGGPNNDTLIVSAGADTFFGEDGFDVAQFYAARSSYTVTRVDAATWKAKNNANSDYVLLNTTERLLFSGHQITALDVGAGQNAGDAYRMYQAAFNRNPDENGLASWVNFLDNGGQQIQMAQQFIQSQEFSTTYGNLDNTAFVQLMYNNVLHRNGEAAGVAGWVDGLNHGMSRAAVLNGFSSSSENVNNVAPKISNGIQYTEWWLN